MNTQKPKIYKGHCQKCGEEYVLVDGLVLVHEFHLPGWFDGYCAGSGAAPMEKRHGITDFAIADLYKDCEGLRELIGYYKNGDDHPRRVAVPPSSSVSGAQYVRWEELSGESQEDVLRLEIARLEKMVRDGESLARNLKARAASVHGLPLVEVDMAEMAS